MKTKLLLLLLIAVGVCSEAWANAAKTQPNYAAVGAADDEEILRPIAPTYLAGAAIPSWHDNWFLSVSGGAAAFIGSPIGCDDLFGRVKPTLQISLGKWHTPAIGTRIVFQGFEWKSGELLSQQYRHWHGDFLWNIMPTLGADSRWDVVPLVGIGLIDNRDADRRPFAINYGIMGRFRVNNSLHFVAEISNATSFRDADGYGSPRRFGDNLLSVSAGISLTFGRHVGWKKVVDATPYIRQNERLSAYAHSLKRRNAELERGYNANVQIIAELRKILDIEGLLDKYLHYFNGSDSTLHSAYPINNYSGLNSLRRRLRSAEKLAANAAQPGAQSDGSSDRNGANVGANVGVNGNDVGVNVGVTDLIGAADTGGDGSVVSIADSASNLSDNGSSSSLAFVPISDGSDGSADRNPNGNSSDYWSLVEENGDCLGAPIYFFFELGTANLVDQSQTVNLNEIARVAGKYGLRIVVTGAADSATGTTEINSDLGSRRASFIANYLAALGIPSAHITARSVGGIATYAPTEANRNAAVRLYLPE